MNRELPIEDNDRTATPEEAKLAEKILLRQDAEALPEEIKRGEAEGEKWRKHLKTDRAIDAMESGEIMVKFVERPEGGGTALEVRYFDGRLEYYSDPLALDKALKEISEREN